MMADIYSEYFANFARTGRPNDDWQPMTHPSGTNYYRIDYVNGCGNYSSIKCSSNQPYYHNDTLEFWIGDVNVNSFERLFNLNRQLQLLSNNTTDYNATNINTTAHSLDGVMTEAESAIVFYLGIALMIIFMTLMVLICIDHFRQKKRRQQQQQLLQSIDDNERTSLLNNNNYDQLKQVF